MTQRPPPWLIRRRLGSSVLAGLVLACTLWMLVRYGPAFPLLFYYEAYDTQRRLMQVWPPGKPDRVRANAERVLPPFPGAAFERVEIRSAMDVVYQECLTWRVADPPDHVWTYYA